MRDYEGDATSELDGLRGAGERSPDLAGSAALPGASPAREGSAAPGERGARGPGPGTGVGPGEDSGRAAAARKVPGGRREPAGREGGRAGGGRPAGGEPGGTGAHEAPTRAVAAILTMGRW